jgi:hypothetical protein
MNKTEFDTKMSELLTKTRRILSLPVDESTSLENLQRLEELGKEGVSFLNEYAQSLEPKE